VPFTNAPGIFTALIRPLVTDSFGSRAKVQPILESTVAAKLRLIILALFCSMPAAYSVAATEQVATIPILIKPECKDMFYGPDFVDIANGKVKKEVREKPDYVPWDPKRAKPKAYKDPRTSIFFYVESDGRHLAAIDPEGNLLWVRNPYEDKPAFCQYRTPRPVIDYIAATEISPQLAALKSWGATLGHTFLEIRFDSSQFGVLDETS
jgi:hypothetical protein